MSKEIPKYLVYSLCGCSDSLRGALEAAKVVDPKKKSVDKDRGCTSYATAASKPDVEVFEELGVCSTDLTETQIRKLTSSSQGISVEKNVLRTISPLFRSGSTRRAAGSGSTRRAAGSGSTRGAAGTDGIDYVLEQEWADDPVFQYVRGHRDGADAILNGMMRGGLGARMSSSAVSQFSGEYVDTPTRSWGLQRLGIGDHYDVATGAGVKIAVLDTGIDVTHPAFRGRLNDPSNLITFSANAQRVNGSAHDGHGHGTHCCGVVGANSTAPGMPMRYSVAPECELLVGKVLDDEGAGYDSAILAGINWAVRRGARVVSLSLGGARAVGEEYIASYERIAEQLLARTNNGVLFVAAAGNGSDHEYDEPAAVENPAACPQFLSVGAVDQQGEIANFSNVQLDGNGLVSFVAPGVNVTSAFPGGLYRSMDGTSMATPHVAGIAGLYFERFPDLSAHDIWHKMEYESQPNGYAGYFGRGVPQAPM